MAAESTRWLDDESWRSLCLKVVRVWVGSEKMSLGMGKRPCSKGSRRGRMVVVVLVEGGSIGSVVMVRVRERKW